MAAGGALWFTALKRKRGALKKGKVPEAHTGQSRTLEVSMVTVTGNEKSVLKGRPWCACVCVFEPQEVGAFGGGSVTQHTY